MRATFVLIITFILECVGAKAEVFKTVCFSEDSGTKTTFFIIADSIKKTGSTNYHNPDLKIGLGKDKSKLEVLSVQDFKDGLVGIKLYDRVSGAKYRIDYIRAKRSDKSPYKPDDSTVAISGRDGSTTHESCRGQE